SPGPRSTTASATSVVGSVTSVRTEAVSCPPVDRLTTHAPTAPSSSSVATKVCAAAWSSARSEKSAVECSSWEPSARAAAAGTAPDRTAAAPATAASSLRRVVTGPPYGRRRERPRTPEGSGEEVEDRLLGRCEPGPHARLGGRLRVRWDRVPALEGVDHLRVDVGGPADGRGVAELLRHPLDGLAHRGLPLARRPDVLRAGQAHGGEHGAPPRAEVLRARLRAEQLLDVAVDVGGGEVRPAPPVAVGEQLDPAAASAAQRGERPGELVVLQLEEPWQAGLRRVLEGQGAVGADPQVVLAQRRQPVGLVAGGVGLPADAERAAVEPPEGDRERLPAA